MSTKAGICPGCSGMCKAAAYPRQDGGNQSMISVL